MKQCVWCGEPHEGKGRSCCKAHDKAYVKNGRRSYAEVHPEMTRICAREGCGNEYDVSMVNVDQKYCSTYCRNKAKRTRYGSTMVDRVCPTCGQTYQTSELSLRKEQKNYCSDDCKPPIEFQREHVEVTCQRCHIQFMADPMTKWCDECRKANKREYDVILQTKKHKLIERICADCGRVFIPVYGQKLRAYCSPTCLKRASSRNGKHRRRERMKKPEGGGIVYRSVIYSRDGWVCQLCGKPVNKRLRHPHPLSATLDHIVPLANGGQHVPENCQLAHFICNSRRSNKGEAQLRLFA